MVLVNRKLLTICGVLVVLFLAGENVLAVAIDNSLSGLEQTAARGFGGKEATKISDAGLVTSLPEAIGRVVGFGLSLIGVVFLLLMIYGGILWMTARGNESDVTKAKDLMQAAVIGLVLVLGAYALTNYVGTLLFAK